MIKGLIFSEVNTVFMLEGTNVKKVAVGNLHNDGEIFPFMVFVTDEWKGLNEENQDELLQQDIIENQNSDNITLTDFNVFSIFYK